ncbi:hypothetical protein ACFC26_14805 [Kitasatospora purpeofusca]|uniref:hypothetical protein n=1 Tax=Kitasatospora purpeofusca TaxID=67352 RepID=UPI0035E01620
MPERRHGPPPLVHVAPRYLAGGPADFGPATALLVSDHGWTRVEHMNSVRQARSPCQRALVTERRRSDHHPLTIDVEAEDGRRWHAALTPRTPEEVTKTMTDALARALREDPDDALGPTGGPADLSRWTPAPGWSAVVHSSDAHVHRSPDGWAYFAARVADSADTGDPRSDNPGYHLVAGPALSPDRWSATLSLGAPPALVELLYAEVSHPSPARRSANHIPAHHLPYVTIRSIDQPSPIRTAALLRSIGHLSTATGPLRLPPEAARQRRAPQR